MEQTLNKTVIEPTTSGTERVHTLIIGASAAGLACAACLRKQHIPYVILERSDSIGFPWRNHYDRLHLNTEKWTSYLPYLPFPEPAEVYLSKNAFVNYMEHYAREFDINPVFGEDVVNIERIGAHWNVKSCHRCWEADHVIMATGLNRKPFIPSWPGLESYSGQVLHSSSFRNGREFNGKDVLVVGFGNSACEIAICLHENGARPSLSVKGPVNVVPRESGGKWATLALHALAFVSKRFPRLADRFSAPLLKKRYGEYAQYGLRQLPYGPNEQIVKHKRVPMLDIGTMGLIKKGAIRIYPGIDHFTSDGVAFADGRNVRFEAVILATGFTSGVNDFIKHIPGMTDPKNKVAAAALPGLYFCGFQVSPSGMLNEIGKEARQIARLIKHRAKK